MSGSLILAIDKQENIKTVKIVLRKTEKSVKLFLNTLKVHNSPKKWKCSSLSRRSETKKSTVHVNMSMM